MKITKDKVISLNYILSNHKTGEKIEETSEQNPFVFLYGAGSLIPEFEQNIDGLSAKETFDFSIKAENAYGVSFEDKIATIPLSVFVDDKGEFVSEMFPIGAMIPMSDNQGNHLQGTIKDIIDGNIIMDFNHPLAGADLHFTGSVLDVRDATKEELDHGHVHGPHGHQH